MKEGTELKHILNHAKKYLTKIIYLAFIAVIVGVIGGIIGAALHKSVDLATLHRTNNPYLIYFLPVVGLAIIFVYKSVGLSTDPGTSKVISSVYAKEEIPGKMAPSIFFATTLTHLFGGSAGRAGAALQVGGAIGSTIGKLIKIDNKTMPLIVLCGMSAVFSAVFGTPLTSVIFTIEMCCVGYIFEAAFIPCFISSYIALYFSILFGNTPIKFHLLSVPDTNIHTILQVVLLGAGCAVISILFCYVMKTVHINAKKMIKNDYLRIFTGGVLIVLLTILCRSYDYNGTGIHIIENATNGNALPYSFLLKILFTAITIGFGFKGGEIMPTLFIGATFGCVIGPILNIPSSFAAATGIVAMFAGVVNCPIASIILALELFGGEGMLLYAAAIFTSHALSGYTGLYSNQKIVFSKNSFETLDIKTK